MRNGELGLLEAEGVMRDGSKEIEDFYADSTPTALITEVLTSLIDAFAPRFGIQDDMPTQAFHWTMVDAAPLEERDRLL